MRALLDTHSFLWYSTDDPALSSRADQLIEDPANEILLSVASLWEIAIKVSIGKLVLTRSFEEAVLAQMSRNGIRLLEIEVRHVLEILRLPHHHRDPFDRLIAAQARVEDIPVIGVDAILDSYGVQRIW